MITPLARDVTTAAVPAIFMRPAEELILMP